MRVPPPIEIREVSGYPLPVFVAPSAQDVSRALARELVEIVRRHRTRFTSAGIAAAERRTRSAAVMPGGGEPGSVTTLGFATGRTPASIYSEFARLVALEQVDTSALRTFHLDEYLDLPRDHPSSFRAKMRAMLYRQIGHPDERAEFPVECDQRDGLEASCARYEARIAEAGGIDWQLLGIGLNGHVAFNEPGAAADSRTRVVTLAESTRLANRADFTSAEEVPRRAATMGIATIHDARRLRIVAFGPTKSAIVHEFLHARVGPEIPATFLRDHPGAELWCDAAAAAEIRSK